MTKQKFRKGDRVVVVSNCMSQGSKGTVISYEEFSWGCGRVVVLLDRGFQLKYNEKSLRKISVSKIENSQEEITVVTNEVQGNYKVAMVRHVQNYANHNTVKVYAFALFDNDIVVGDKVLCDSEGGYSVAEVIDILSKQEYANAHSRVVTKEIICRVDFTNFDKRVANRKEMATIKAEMDRLVAENQNLVLYRAIAENNPAMLSLLERYQELLREQ